MTDSRTTLLGIGEAFLIALTPEILLEQPTWKHRAVAVGLALLRAAFGVLAADARAKATAGPPSPAEDPRRVG